MASVKTKPGGHLHTSGDRGANLDPYTSEQLAEFAKKANDEATKLGIKTRYEVVE